MTVHARSITLIIFFFLGCSAVEATSHNLVWNGDLETTATFDANHVATNLVQNGYMNSWYGTSVDGFLSAPTVTNPPIFPIAPLTSHQSYVGLSALKRTVSTFANGGYREYIMGKLDSQLIVKMRYDVSFYTALSSQSTLAIDRLGLGFTLAQPFSVQTNLGIGPAAGVTKGAWVTDGSHFAVKKWRKIHNANYIAQGNERFLVMGNLDQTPTIQPARYKVLAPANRPHAYYYFDKVDVSCKTDDEFEINYSSEFVVEVPCGQQVFVQEKTPNGNMLGQKWILDEVDASGNATGTLHLETPDLNIVFNLTSLWSNPLPITAVVDLFPGAVVNFAQGHYYKLTRETWCHSRDRPYYRAQIFHIQNPHIDIKMSPHSLDEFTPTAQAGTSITFSADANETITEIQWTLEHADPMSTTFTTTRIWDEPGEYLVRLQATLLSGCTTGQDWKIRIIKQATYFPTAFTPNGDFLNETFKPAGKDVYVHSLVIFSRWGDVAYSSSDHTQIMSDGWDGKTKDGKNAPDGVYQYQAVIGSPYGDLQKKTITGSVIHYR